MEAVLRFAPAPVLSRFWEAGAQALKTVRNLFAAKLLAANPAREKADVNVRAAEILDELVAENRDDLSFVWQAVRDLPEKYRAPVHLFYHEGYSTKQIAEILQRGEATVRSDLHRGRALLREILKEAYDFDEIR